MKLHYTIIGICLLFLTGLSTVKAQDTFLPGYVILNDGTKIGGSISLYENAPWLNQRFIWLKDSTAVAKPKKYKVGDIKSYQVGDRSFEKVHYVDMENIQFKTLGANDHMMERLSSGKINSFKFYSYPEEIEVYVGLSSAEVAERTQQKKGELLRGYKILSSKDDDKLRNAFDYDLQKYFKDTPAILEKYKKGEYGNEPIVKMGLAAKMISMARKAAFKPKEADAIVMAFNDYNNVNLAK
ncbi:hypothetical protein [Mucilaginibacter sp.]|uniref:hypothetical protein n=1 Tax=Mucilaginibacter sp. TaxID=1882438 RepID=UPI00262D19D1|nr:hypothetical protein [Mucilaginibacter sp.]MDB5126896.1 hypothetical protein [Mucilaginibacter sp.]